MNGIEQLIEDALHGRRMAGTTGSCLVSNEAGLELLQCQSNIAINLENAIRAIDAALREGSATVGQFGGLDYVIGGYLVNAARHDSKRAVAFMNTLCPVMLREFIANVPVFFRKIEVGYNFGVAPPREYVEFAKEHTDSIDSAVAETARRVVSRMSN